MKKIIILCISFFFIHLSYTQTGDIPALSKDKNYGFKRTKPIKVGGGVIPSKVYEYLNNLRGVNGEEIEYVRLGTGTSYSNPDPTLTPFKQGVLTLFKVRVKGTDQWKVLYFDQYRFDT